jgi:hypothetical protein
MTSEPVSRSARIRSLLKELIARLVRDAIPVDGAMWVDLKGRDLRLEGDSAAATRPCSQAAAGRVTTQQVQPPDGSVPG